MVDEIGHFGALSDARAMGPEDSPANKRQKKASDSDVLALVTGRGPRSSHQPSEGEHSARGVLRWNPAAWLCAPISLRRKELERAGQGLGGQGFGQ